jgi:hypothetical protein
MAEYYKNRPSATTLNVSRSAVIVDDEDGAATSAETTTSTKAAPVYISEFDRQREALLSDDMDEGWASELRHYLNVVERDVKKDADLVEWWQVSNLLIFRSSLTSKSF